MGMTAWAVVLMLPRNAGVLGTQGHNGIEHVHQEITRKNCPAQLWSWQDGQRSQDDFQEKRQLALLQQNGRNIPQLKRGGREWWKPSGKLESPIYEDLSQFLFHKLIEVAAKRVMQKACKMPDQCLFSSHSTWVWQDLMMQWESVTW